MSFPHATTQQQYPPIQHSPPRPRISQIGGVPAASCSVESCQNEATRVWQADLRSLLTRAEERFADVCWTTAPPEDDDNLTDNESSLGHRQDRQNMLIDWGLEDRASIADASQHTIIWAHKAILYARAPNTFQARYLKLRSPAAQLHQLGSTASLVSLPTLRSVDTPQGSRSVTPVHDKPGSISRTRKSVRGSAPPSSFFMRKFGSKRPNSRNSGRSSFKSDDAGSLTSGVMTSDSEGEGLALIRTSSSSRGSQQPTPSTVSSRGIPRMASFSSDTESIGRDTASILSEASTVRAPMSLDGVSQPFFEATLEYLYTGEESMVDAFEFLFEDRLSTDAEKGPGEKLEKLRSDMTFMWRSKLYSDVKIVLDNGDGYKSASLDTDRNMPSIPDANASTLSLSQTIDTDRMDESDAEDDELTSFSSHRMILASRSPYFASMLLNPYSDSTSPVLTLPSPPFSPASLHFALGFLYTGTLFFSNRTFDLSTAFQLWRAGAYLQVASLQALVASMIVQDFCHKFACSPPCRKCLKRVPRTLAFASSPDVDNATLAALAMEPLSGPYFGFYWGKEVGNLESSLRTSLVNIICEKVERQPAQILSVLRQLSIVGRKIDTERASKWVDALRWMSESIETRLTPILGLRFNEIVKSRPWADLLNGVEASGDVLEKSLVMLVDGLTESRAPKVYQTLVGQVLLRDEGIELATSKQAIEDARGGILRYLKKRWINARFLSAFNNLEKWCLKELADELDVPSADLILPDEPPATELAKTRTGLRPTVGMKPTTADKAVVTRRAVSGNASAVALGKAATPRRSMSANPSRLRTASNASASSATKAEAASSPTTTSKADAEVEREAGPINLRAAVLNRNAARTSVTHGHRTSLAPAAVSPSTAPKTTGSPVSTRATSLTARRGKPASPSVSTAAPRASSRALSSASQGSPAAARVRTTSAASSTLSIRSRPPSSIAKDPSATPAAPGTSRLTPRTSVNSIKCTASSVRPPQSVAPVSPNLAKPALKPTSRASSRSSNASMHSAEESASPPTPSSSVMRQSHDTTPKKLTASPGSLRSTKSSTALRPPAPAFKAARPSSSMDKAPARSPAPAAPASAKHSYLKATPRPGGIFSLTATNSGNYIRARTLSRDSASSQKRVATPATATARKVGSNASLASTRAAAAKAAHLPPLPANATKLVEAAKEPMQVEEPSSTAPAEEPPGAESDDDAFDLDATITGIEVPKLKDITNTELPKKLGGTVLSAGIPCIVSPSGPKLSTRFKATVRYIGPLHGHLGSWIGVQVSLPLPHAITDCPGGLNDGSIDGVRYFDVHSSQRYQERSERRDRRRRILQQIGHESESEDEQQAVKKREVDCAALFIKPQDVLWVVSSD